MTTADRMDVTRVREQLEDWDADIERMKARADLILMDLEERYYRVLRDLRLREHVVKAALLEIDGAGREADSAVNLNLHRAVEELEQALDKVPPELE